MVKKKEASKSRITAARRRVSHSGSCLACMDQPHTVVTEVTINSLMFRVCDKCRDVLIHRLGG